MKDRARIILTYLSLFTAISIICAFLTTVSTDIFKTDYNCQPVGSFWEPAILNHTIASYSSAFKPISESQNVYSWGMIKIRGNVVFFRGSLNEHDRDQLISFDIKKKQPNWQLCEIQALDIDSNHIYVGHTDYWAFVSAYDIETGARLWHTKTDNRVISNVKVTPIGLLATTNNHGDERYYLLDFDTGRKEKTFRDYLARDDFFSERDQRVYRLTGRGIASLGKSQWEVEFDYSPDPFETQVVLDNAVVLVNVREHHISQIVVFDESGVVLWQTEKNVKSDIAVANGVVFFITKDSELVAHDLYTGNKVGQITFVPGLEVMSEFDFINSYPRVAADGDFVVVYFDSGRQLFAFRFLPGE